MKKAQFKNLKFKSDIQLNKWLKKIKSKIIDLRDLGQDMQRIWVHETGEILNTDFHSSIYVGKFIDMNKLAVGGIIHIWEEGEDSYKPYFRLVVEKLS